MSSTEIQPAEPSVTAAPVTLLMFPSGMPVALFSAMTDLLGTALGDDAEVVLRPPAAWQENSTVTVNNLAGPQISRRLRAATGIIDGSPRHESDCTELDDSDGLPVATLGSAIKFSDSGVDFNLGFDDATHDQGMAMLALLAKSMAEQLADNPEAVNYLRSWFDPETRENYRLIGVRPGQPTPHELRAAAEAECDRLRQLLVDHGFDPGSPAGSA